MLPKSLHPIYYPTTLEELEALRVLHNRELRPQMIAIHSMFSGALHNSPSRSVMTTQHFPQHLVVSGLERPIVFTGLEYQMGDYTFAQRMPETGEIVRVIPRYARGVEGINGQPQLFVIYRKESNGQYAFFTIDQYRSFHQHFGFANKFTPAFNMLYAGAKIAGGTKFADTPGCTDDVFYCYGVNLETACVDVPGVAEDGVIIARSALKKLRIKVFEQLDVSFGRDSVPLNIGNIPGKYKICPDIGEYVGEDGLVMVLRPNLSLMSPVSMNEKNLREIDHVSDEKIYTREKSIDAEMLKHSELVHGGKVIDIRVTRNPDSQHYLPPTMTEQLDKYAQALKGFYNEMLNFEFRATGELKKMNRDAELNLDPGLVQELAYARGVIGHTSHRFQGVAGHQYRRNALDEYTIHFVIEHELEPREGWKITDCNGG